MEIKYIHELLSIPYILGGRSRQGVDCWGLVYLIYREKLTIQLPQFIEFDYLRKIYQKQKSCAEHWREVADAVPYDVVLLSKNKIPHHVGMMLDRDTIIHTQQRIGVRVLPISKVKKQFNSIKIYRYASRSLCPPSH